jgi:hypothetical protein
MPELDVADAEGVGRGDTILVSLPPPDGASVAAALRERGFSVSEAPLPLLAARVLAEAPRVMIVDVDLPGAVDAVERAREASSVELLCVGDAMRAAELGAGRVDGRSFARPIDLEALVLSVLALAEPAAPLPSRGTVPPGYARARETTPPPRRFDSDAPLGSEAGSEVGPESGSEPGSEYPSTSDPLEIAVILPALDEGESGAALAPVELSPELAQILDDAEQRVSDLGRLHPSNAPSSDEEEPDLLLPPELLSWLDEPLDPDDGSASGASTGGSVGSTSTVGMGYPKPKTLGEAAATGATGPITSAQLDKGESGVEATRAGRPSGAPTAAGMAPLSTSVPSVEPPAPSLPVRFGGAPPPAEPPPDRPLLDAPPRSLDERFEPQRPPAEVRLPAVLGEGDAVRALSIAIAARVSGSIALGPDAATRRVVLHEGDVVTAASGTADETLIAFLAGRGDIERDVAARLASRLPAHGRHAGAALIAHGHLGQDDLWPVLRAHAEWIIGRALLCDEGTCELEPEPPGRLKAEPNVFGGATGAEVLLEQIRRVVPPELALRRLGGKGARLAEGPRRQLLAECALRPHEEHVVRTAAGMRVGEVLTEAEPELADVLYGLVSLGVLEVLAPAAPAEAAPAGSDPLDEEALRQRVRARVALVEDADYFALLGVARGATGYEIRRAYLELRRAFEPGRVLTAATADLAADVRLVIEVLDEAYEILREPHRRERYRRAIEAGPP